jgi:hypothetical protein
VGEARGLAGAGYSAPTKASGTRPHPRGAFRGTQRNRAVISGSARKPTPRVGKGTDLMITVTPELPSLPGPEAARSTPAREPALHLVDPMSDA